jgi:hypothetical protein
VRRVGRLQPVRRVGRQVGCPVGRLQVGRHLSILTRLWCPCKRVHRWASVGRVLGSGGRCARCCVCCGGKCARIVPGRGLVGHIQLFAPRVAAWLRSSSIRSCARNSSFGIGMARICRSRLVGLLVVLRLGAHVPQVGRLQDVGIRRFRGEVAPVGVRRSSTVGFDFVGVAGAVGVGRPRDGVRSLGRMGIGRQDVGRRSSCLRCLSANRKMGWGMG